MVDSSYGLVGSHMDFTNLNYTVNWQLDTLSFVNKPKPNQKTDWPTQTEYKDNQN